MAKAKAGPSTRARAERTPKTTMSAPSTRAEMGARGAGGLVQRLVGMVRRPEELRLAPGDPLEQLLGHLQLDLEAERRDAREIRMGEGVVPDDVPLGELAAHQVGTSLRVLADEEEGGVHAA